MVSPLLLLLAIPGPERANLDRLASAPVIAARIDSLTGQYWQANTVQPAAAVRDAAFLRRLTLDLAGRIPTAQEAQAFAANPEADKRSRAVRRLMESPDYALHLGRMLDDMIQGKFAGDPEFLNYLRSAAATHRPWDQLFRDVLLGPWDDAPRKGADRFLLKRVNSLDDLTNDTARVFFGVNVSCAKCHDHPLVPDWTQDHYYGMASFFNPTYEGSKSKGKAGTAVTEKATSPVTFMTTKGERRTAKMMFLSSRVVDDEPKAQLKTARRQQLVEIALEEKKFFSRAVVNKFWAFFMGRGLVAPIDQMHSANPPAIPELLDWLADDLAAHGYDLDRLVAGLVSSRVYQLASSRDGNGESLSERMFGQSSLRPLTPPQLALSLVIATGDGSFDQATDAAARGRRYRELETAAGRLIQPGLLDVRGERYQSSTGEALFMSNHAEVQRLLVPADNNLVARLIAIDDTAQRIDAAFWTILNRMPDAEERSYLSKWIEARGDRTRTASQLAWALLTSAEFRFNH